MSLFLALQGFLLLGGFPLFGSEIAAVSVSGWWESIDDRFGRPHALIRIVEGKDGWEGYVEKLIQILPGDDPSGLCVRCEGRWKNQPVIGMRILWGMRKEGTKYVGGQILDPNNGKIYSCEMKLLDGGKKLEVRGFLGIALLGRTQVWLREAQPHPVRSVSPGKRED